MLFTFAYDLFVSHYLEINQLVVLLVGSLNYVPFVLEPHKIPLHLVKYVVFV